MVRNFVYEPDRAGFAQLMNGPGVTAYVASMTSAALAHAQSIAPADSGEYRARLRTEAGTETSRGTKRPVGRVVAEVDHAYAVERRHKVMSRTADRIENG